MAKSSFVVSPSPFGRPDPFIPEDEGLRVSDRSALEASMSKE
jgi:hypothetical protein